MSTATTEELSTADKARRKAEARRKRILAKSKMEIVGKPKEGTTATDLVLTITEILRKKGVVGKFVEFFGSGLKDLSVADRATIANMAPEYGATCGIFPIDNETIKFLESTGRPKDEIALTKKYAKE